VSIEKIAFPELFYLVQILEASGLTQYRRAKLQESPGSWSQVSTGKSILGQKPGFRENELRFEFPVSLFSS
jgi:hypothetical protein